MRDSSRWGSFQASQRYPKLPCVIFNKGKRKLKLTRRTAPTLEHQVNWAPTVDIHEIDISSAFPGENLSGRHKIRWFVPSDLYTEDRFGRVPPYERPFFFRTGEERWSETHWSVSAVEPHWNKRGAYSRRRWYQRPGRCKADGRASFLLLLKVRGLNNIVSEETRTLGQYTYMFSQPSATFSSLRTSLERQVNPPGAPNHQCVPRWSVPPLAGEGPSPCFPIFALVPQQPTNSQMAQAWAYHFRPPLRFRQQVAWDRRRKWEEGISVNVAVSARPRRRS